MDALERLSKTYDHGKVSEDRPTNSSRIWISCESSPSFNTKILNPDVKGVELR